MPAISAPIKSVFPHLQILWSYMYFLELSAKCLDAVILPEQKAHLRARSLFLIPSSEKRTQGSGGNWLNGGLHSRYETEEPGSARKQDSANKNKYPLWGYVKGTQEPHKGALNGQS